jgi:NAD(P)-dependent dehydrogenase (short-subunit alcohol dehydrogenase family)
MSIQSLIPSSYVQEDIGMAKVWLITGSGNGLGRDIAEAALAAGDNVVAGARRTGELANTTGAPLAMSSAAWAMRRSVLHSAICPEAGWRYLAMR